jgi:hypothetical protein
MLLLVLPGGLFFCVARLPVVSVAGCCCLSCLVTGCLPCLIACCLCCSVACFCCLVALLGYILPLFALLDAAV